MVSLSSFLRPAQGSLIPLLLALGLSSGCDGEKAKPAPVSVMVDDGVTYACRYQNPFSMLDECRTYYGPWTRAAVDEACDTVFTGISGVVDEEPCVDDGSIGICTSNSDEMDRHFRIWFYGGEAEVTSRLCAEFLDGSWTAFEGDTPVPTPPPTTTPLEDALTYVASTDAVTVSPECIDDTCLDALVAAEDGIVFTPTAAPPTVGFVIYPGAQVDPRAYAPVAREIAGHGVLTVIVPMPGQFALNGWDRAGAVMRAFPDIQSWYLGGHSMGGAMTAHYAKLNPGVMSGLVLWAAYAGGADDLSESDAAVTSIYADLDGVATVDEVDQSRPLLPADTRYVLIRGGNHAQFGLYGEQAGDGKADIPAAVQWQQVAAATVHFIRTIEAETVPVSDTRFEEAPTSTWCAEAQRVLSATDAADSVLQIEVFDDMDGFARSKPALDALATQPLKLSAYVRDHGNASHLDAPPILPREVWCKVKSQKAVTEGLELGAERPQGTCADVNRAAITWAASQLSPSDRDLLASAAIQIEYLADEPHETGLGWLVDGGVVVDVANAPTVSIRSATLTVGDQLDLPEDERLPEAYRDVVYCKLLAPTEALRWLSTLIQPER